MFAPYFYFCGSFWIRFVIYHFDEFIFFVGTSFQNKNQKQDLGILFAVEIALWLLWRIATCLGLYFGRVIQKTLIAVGITTVAV